jgi:recombination protein RecR
VSSDPLRQLSLQLARLPGLGDRSAARLALYVVGQSKRCTPSLAEDLAAALLSAAQDIRTCVQCANYSVADECEICADARRDRKGLCVVQSISDLWAIEASLSYRGLYHVLHGALAPLDGVGPEELGLGTLVERVDREAFDEVILATNTQVEGDTTALYVARLLKPMGVKLTRLASGVPMGGELEYLDGATLERAFAQRLVF